jgi:hypothetical protein
MRPIYGGLKGKNVRSTNVAKQRMPSANVFDVKKSLERGRKKPSAVSGVVPTYGRRLFTLIYTRRVIILSTPKGNYTLNPEG